MRRIRRGSFVVALCGALSTFAAAAEAQDEVPPEQAALAAEPLADPSTERPMYVALGLGPAVSLRGGGALFELEQSFGYHLMAHGEHPGLFVGAALSEAFRSGGTRLQIGARAGFDFNVFSSEAVTLLVAPMATLGAAVYVAKYTDPFTGDTVRDSFGAFHMGFAGELRVVVADGQVTAFARPVALDFDIRNGTGVYWDFLFGAAYNF